MKHSRFTFLLTATFAVSAPSLRAQQEKEELPAAQDLRAGDDEHKRYFLVGPKSGAQAPKTGFKLLLVLPGGNGGADFSMFVRRIAAHATGDDWLVAQLIAPMWTKEQAEKCVWPTRKTELPEMKFATEDFVAAVVRDVASRHRVDAAHVFALAWSSGGPAAYAASLDRTTGVTGTFVAMSVFKPDQLPPLKQAQGHAYFVLHSPKDFIPIAMAKKAARDLKANGAATQLLEYDGGHGWRGDVYGNMRQGLQWLAQNHAEPDPKVKKALEDAQKKPRAGGNDK